MTSMPTGDPAVASIVAAAADAVAAVLPASEQLGSGDPQPGNEHVTGLFAGAAMADLTGSVPGRVAVLVGEELVAALKSSPLGGLDLGAAVQPALDAVAQVLGAGASAAREVDLELVVADLGGPFTAVPLIGSTIAAALLVPDAVLAAVVGGPSAAPAVAVAAAAPAGTAAAVPAMATAPTGAIPGVSAPLPQAGVYPMPPGPRRGIEMLHGVEMEVTVELGRARMPVRDLLALAPGAVLQLDRAAGSPADLLVNGRLIARGEVVVVDEDFGLRITEILDESAAV